MQEETFWQIVKEHCAAMQPRTISMAHDVLVEGRLLRDVAKQHNVTVQRVCLAKQQVLRNWSPPEAVRFRAELCGLVERSQLDEKTRTRLLTAITKVLR